jgi:hypothetical protein
MALNRVPFPSPNYSSRGGAAVRLICIHTAEGSRTIESLGSFFANPAAGVSSHTGADDKADTVGEFVRRDYKSWTAAEFNPVAVQIELCAFAAWSPAEWANHPNMLANCAAWIAEEAAAFGIPIVALSPGEAQGGGRGVCQHRDLGSRGGNHSDCGNGFPFAQVLAMAAGGTPALSQEVHNMIAVDEATGGVWVAGRGGEVYVYDGAPWLGACNNLAFNAARWPCVGIAPWGIGGYMLVLDTEVGDYNPDRYLRYHFPRDGSGAA